MAFEGVDYDIMDVGAENFANDYYQFRLRIKELERRLASLLIQAFEDACCIQARFNMFDSFDALLERPNIKEDIEKKFIVLVRTFGNDMLIVQEIFLSRRDDPPVSHNKPPVSGAIAWCKSLIARIYNPWVKLQNLPRSTIEMEEAREVLKRYAGLRASLEEYVTQKVGEWGRDVEATSHAKLQLPLLRREKESRLLSVNFDKQLVKLLREVKYFLSMEMSVPESAMAIHAKVSSFVLSCFCSCFAVSPRFASLLPIV